MKRRYLGNITSLQQDLKDVEEGLEFAEGSAREELLQTKADIEREIAELENKGSDSSSQEPVSKTTKPKTQRTKSTTKKKESEECADPSEIERLKRELAEAKSQNKGNATRRRSASKRSKVLKKMKEGKKKTEKPSNSQAKTKNSGGKKKTTAKTATKRKNLAQRRAEGSTNASRPKKGVAKQKRTTSTSTKTQTPRKRSTPKTQTDKTTTAPKVNKRQQAQQTKNEAEIVKRSAQANEVTQKIGKEFMSYLFITDAVKKFNKNIGKDASFGWHHNLYTAIKNGNEAKRFNKNSPAFGAMKLIFESLEKSLNNEDFFRSKGKTSKVGADISADERKMLEDIVEADKDFLTAHYAKKFMSIAKTKNKKSADALVKQINNAKIKKGITTDMPFYKEMEEARKKAEKYDFTVSETLQGIHSKTKSLRGFLNGLGSLAGIGCTCEMNEKKKSNRHGFRGLGNTDEEDYQENDNDIMTAPEILQKTYDSYNFTGEWKNILKNPEKNFTAMVYGKPGAGKSTMCLQLAQYLANHFGKVLYVSAEEHDSKTLQDNMELNGIDSENIEFTDDFRDKDLGKYKFVFFDSVAILGITQEEFIELKEQYPKTALILIFQTTKSGAFRGEQTWEHNVDAVIRVTDGQAENTKRYSGNAVYGIK